MKAIITCPLCDWSIDEPIVQYAPGVAAAFGITPSALASIHLSQEMRRTEEELDRHLRTHPPTDWLPALMAARKKLDSAQEMDDWS